MDLLDKDTIMIILSYLSTDDIIGLRALNREWYKFVLGYKICSHELRALGDPRDALVFGVYSQSIKMINYARTCYGGNIPARELRECARIIGARGFIELMDVVPVRGSFANIASDYAARAGHLELARAYAGRDERLVKCAIQGGSVNIISAIISTGQFKYFDDLYAGAFYHRKHNRAKCARIFVILSLLRELITEYDFYEHIYELIMCECDVCIDYILAAESIDKGEILLLCAQNRNRTMISRIIAAGARNLNEAIYIAFANGNIEAVRELFPRAGVLAQELITSYSRAFISREMVQFLDSVMSPRDPDILMRELSDHVKGVSVDAYEYLISVGATCLDDCIARASVRGKIEVCKYLLSRGADPARINVYTLSDANFILSIIERVVITNPASLAIIAAREDNEELFYISISHANREDMYRIAEVLGEYEIKYMHKLYQRARVLDNVISLYYSRELNALHIWNCYWRNEITKYGARTWPVIRARHTRFMRAIKVFARYFDIARWLNWRLKHRGTCPRWHVYKKLKNRKLKLGRTI